jgi:hypothetical protein
MKKRTRFPPEKKALSYVKDRRNGFAKSRSIAHRAISKRKTAANQAYRSATRAVMTKELRAHPDLEEADVYIARTGTMAWRKGADISLATHLENKIESRPSRGMASNARASVSLSAARRKVRDRHGR